MSRLGKLLISVCCFVGELRILMDVSLDFLNIWRFCLIKLLVLFVFFGFNFIMGILFGVGFGSGGGNNGGGNGGGGNNGGSVVNRYE